MNVEKLGVLNLTELDKVKSSLKSRTGKVLKITGKQYQSVKDGYASWLARGGAPMYEEGKYTNIPRIAIDISKRHYVSRGTAQLALAGILYAAKKYPEFAKIISPVKYYAEKTAVKTYQKKAKGETKSLGKRIAETVKPVAETLVVPVAHETSNTMKYAAVGAVAIAAALIVSKFKH